VGEEFGMPSGGYVFHEAGIASNEHGAWVVKKDDGAIWATDVDPSTSPTTGGPCLPAECQSQNRCRRRRGRI
jgi:hypothetical protein